jgi:WD40 repeat protein
MNKLTVYVCFSLASLLATGVSVASDDKVGVTSQHPAVSPAGQQLVFAADFDGAIRLWIARLDGTGLRKVSSSSNPSTAVADIEPAWSPDGRQICYTSSNGQNSDIWVMAADGTYPSKLTSNGANNMHPAWSPDGRKIAFVSDKDGTKDIWIMNADGTGQVKLLNSPSEENKPSFSPAGDRIVFSKTDGDTATLAIVNVDGTGLRALTTGNFRDWEASWGLGGILFSSNRDATSERWKIWQIQADGTGLRKVGDVPGHDSIWLPNGQIAFTDEGMVSKALAAVSILNPVTGVKRVVADVQGYLTPIDIRPGNTLNQINPGSTGRPEVAILSTRSFDATKAVVQATITFGRTGAENSLVSCSKTFRDVNNDGLPDLICRIGLRSAGFQMGNSIGILRFTDIRGIPYEGRDAITTVSDDDPNDFKN